MPLWIVENPSTTYFILGLLALGMFVGLWVRKERKYLFGLGVVAVLALLVALLDHFVITDFEQIEAHVRDMAAAVGQKDDDRAFSHFSEQFKVGPAGKKEFRNIAGPRIKAGEVTELKVWDFERLDVSREKRKSKVAFLVKANGAQFDDRFLRCVATFALEPDDVWRMTSFELKDPMKDPAKGDTVEIPYLPR